MRTAAPTAVAAAITLAVVIAACGGEDRRNLVADADRLCTDAAIEEERIRREAGPLRTNEEIGALLRELAPVRRELADEIGQLDPPDRLSLVLEELSDAIRHRARLSELAAERASGADAEFRRRVAVVIASRVRVRGAARALGMEECAGAVPAHVREELEEIVEEILVQSGPEELCESLVSERLLVELWGGPRRCRREVEGEPRPRRVTVTDAVGIPDVRLELAVRQSGLPGPSRLGLRLVFEDGRYKLDAVGLPGRTVFPLPMSSRGPLLP